jgi:oligoribonuclease NrnB/cAMP/cGMP phosphodiesterase (DHH superfamily)
MKTAIIYHKSDLDGIGSAAIVLKHYPDAELYPANYGDEDYNVKDFTGKRVIIVDFCPEEIRNIYMHSAEFIWIDHHKSASERHEEMWKDDDIKGFRSMNHSAIMLTWMYFEHNDINLADPHNAPDAVKYIEDYDIWKFEFDNLTKAFGEYAPLILTSPEEPEWEKLLSNNKKDYNNLVQKYIENGNILLKKKKSQIEQSFKSLKEINKWGYKVGMVNTDHNHSNLGNYIANNGYDIGMLWYVRGDEVNIGLRSTGNIDVKSIAMKYKGGGHFLASGCRMKLKDFYEEFLQ